MTVELFLKAPTDQIVSGTPLRVRTLVRNTGAAPIELPPSDELSPVVFVVRDSDGREVTSGSAKDEFISGLQVPAPEAAPKPVSPGGEIAYEEDVSSYFGKPLPPGQYQLIAQLRQTGLVVASASAIIHVSPLIPDVAVRAVSNKGLFLSTLIAHRRTDGSKDIFYVYADRSARWSDTLRPVLKLPSGMATPSLALVPRILADSSFAWIVVLDGEMFHGTLVRPFDMASAFGPARSTIGPAHLLEAGIPLADGGASVFAVGQERDALLVINIDRRGKTRFHPMQVPPGLPKSASRLIAAAKGGDSVHLCWVEGDKSIYELFFRSMEPEKGASLRTVYQTPGRILTIQSDPPASGQAASLYVLEAPPPPASSMLFKHIGLDQNAAIETAPLPPLPFVISDAQHWVLPSSEPAATGPILVTAASKTWLLENGTWKTVDVKHADSPGARLIRFGGTLWLSTLQSRKSLDLQRIPE